MRNIFLIVVTVASMIFFSCESGEKTKETKIQESRQTEVKTPEVNDQTTNNIVENEEDKKVEEQSPASEGGKVIYLNTQQFKEKVWDYTSNTNEWKYKGDKPCVIDFYADWCKPCKMIAPIMDDLAKTYADEIIIYKVNTDHNRELSQIFQIRSIPSVMFVPLSGQPAMQTGAMQREGYVQAIETILK